MESIFTKLQILIKRQYAAAYLTAGPSPRPAKNLIIYIMGGQVGGGILPLYQCFGTL